MLYKFFPRKLTDHVALPHPIPLWPQPFKVSLPTFFLSKTTYVHKRKQWRLLAQYSLYLVSFVTYKLTSNEAWNILEIKFLEKISNSNLHWFQFPKKRRYYFILASGHSVFKPKSIVSDFAFSDSVKILGRLFSFQLSPRRLVRRFFDHHKIQSYNKLFL